MEVRTHLVPRSNNTKTADIPTVWIGATRPEARASCDTVKCPLRPWSPEAKAGGIKCYAWSGSPLMALASVEKMVARNNDTVPDMEEQLKKRSASARFIRIGAIGDPGVLPWGWWYKIGRMARKHGLGILSYTHNWRVRPDLVGHTMASCDSLEDAVEARKMGFQVAVATRDVDVADKNVTLADGSKAIVCPNMSVKAKGKPAPSCNSCGLCTGKNPNLTIVFPAHGKGEKV